VRSTMCSHAMQHQPRARGGRTPALAARFNGGHHGIAATRDRLRSTPRVSSARRWRGYATGRRGTPTPRRGPPPNGAFAPREKPGQPNATAHAQGHPKRLGSHPRTTRTAERRVTHSRQPGQIRTARFALRPTGSNERRFALKANRKRMGARPQGTNPDNRRAVTRTKEKPGNRMAAARKVQPGQHAAKANAARPAMPARPKPEEKKGEH